MKREMKMMKPNDVYIANQEISDLADVENLILEDENRIRILVTNKSIDVQACPGSGKTTLIAAKLILLAKMWNSKDRGVCVLSHTNVAKDEIIQRLIESKSIEANKLLNYPNFIGTIQEFVGHYIAYPLIRSKEFNVKIVNMNGEPEIIPELNLSETKIQLVDTEKCVELIGSRLDYGTINYLNRGWKKLDFLYELDLNFVNGNITVNIPRFKKPSDSDSYIDMLKTKLSLISDGYFFYRDIFAFAQIALHENLSLIDAIQNRFPFVFIDEMQDTQKYQDNILSKVFSFSNPDICVQRFGDPDQAIFNDFGLEVANESFNEKSAQNMDFILSKSIRFTNEIAKKIAGYSYNEIKLESELSQENVEMRKEDQKSGSNFENTIIIYDDEKILDVIPKFLQIIEQQFSIEKINSKKFTVKIVGAVGNEIDPEKNQLKIGHYWPEFRKQKSNKEIREKTFIETVYSYRQNTNIDWSENYNSLINCIIKLLDTENILDCNNKKIRLSTFRDYLNNKGKWENFRDFVFKCFNPQFELNQQNWNQLISQLLSMFDLQDISENLSKYFKFNDVYIIKDRLENESIREYIFNLNNIIVHPENKFKVEVSTIHSVKGETHDATLVLETMVYEICDMGTMLPYLTGELPTENFPNSSLPQNAQSKSYNKQFMRQFYVGMSRPKHLLCLAIHKNRINIDQKDKLSRLGWHFDDLTQ